WRGAPGWPGAFLVSWLVLVVGILGEAGYLRPEQVSARFPAWLRYLPWRPSESDGRPSDHVGFSSHHQRGERLCRSTAAVGRCAVAGWRGRARGRAEWAAAALARQLAPRERQRRQAGPCARPRASSASR